jgi:hypothetical protein
MANNIKPEISLGVKGPQTMSLGELAGTATKLVEFQRLSELYPELIKKTQQEVRAQELAIANTEYNQITNSLVATANHPLVIAAEQDPNSVNQQELIGYLTKAGMDHARAMKIPESRARELIAPVLRVAQENPGNVRTLLKEYVMTSLDASTRASTIGSVGATTIPTGRPEFRPQGVRPQDMTAPMRGPIPGQNLMVAPVTENRVDVSPIQAGPQVASSAPAGVPAGAPAGAPMGAPMGAPVGLMTEPTAGIPPLRYKPPVAGVPHAKLAGEDEAMRFGQDFRNTLGRRALDLTRSDENLDQVVRSATKIMKEATLPETGAIGGIKRKFAEFTGDPTYQKLKKDIAQAQQANLNALSAGGNSVAGLELNRDAMGDINYSPDVLIDIARRTKADNTNLRLMYQGLDKHSLKFGDANADRYAQMWIQNADSKIFQLMNIDKDITNPQEKKAAAAKVLEGMSPQQRQILNDKYQRINRLVQTGDLRQ